MPCWANSIDSAMSLRVPTMDPRTVIRFSTTPKIGVGKFPGGRPTRLTVPFLRTSSSAWVNAGTETAVTSTPCAPPPVALTTCAAASGRLASTAMSAPSLRASAELLLGDVQRRDVEAHGAGVLNCDVTESSDAGDREPLTRASFGFLDALVSGNPGTKNRRHGCKVDAVRKSSDVGRTADRVFSEAAVHAVAATALGLAQRFPAGDAVLAGAASVVQPGDADRVAFLQAANVGADRRNDARTFVPGNEQAASASPASHHRPRADPYGRRLSHGS